MRVLPLITLLICGCSGKINNLNIFGYQTGVPATMDSNAKENMDIQEEKDTNEEKKGSKGGKIINAIKKLEGK